MENHLYREVIQKMPIGLLVLRLEGTETGAPLRIINGNAIASRLLGTSLESLLAHTLAATLPSLLSTELPTTCQEVLCTAQSKTLHEVYYSDHGVKGYFSLSIFALSANCVGVTFFDVTERKLAEERLVEAQQMAHLGYWEWDIPSDTIIWSDELYRMFGYEPQSIAIDFSTYLDHIHPNDRQMVQETVGAAQQTGQPFSYTFRIIRRDGEVRTLLGRGAVVVDADGTPVKMRGTAQDITERRAVEENLRRSRMRLMQAQRLAHVGDWEWDLHDNTVLYSEELAHILGIDPQEGPTDFSGMMEQIHPDDRSFVRQTIERAVTDKRQFSINFRLQRATGEERVVHTIGNVVVDRNGAPQRMWGTTQDITERWQAEQNLRASESRLRSITDSANDAIISFNNEGVTIFWNPGAEQIFGYEAHEAVGTPIEMLIPAMQVVKEPDGNTSFVMDREPLALGRGLELTACTKEGQEFPIELSLGTWTAHDKPYYTAVVRNISKRKQAEMELKSFATKLEASNRELQDFAYIASHDLQEPLRKITAFGDRLRMKYGDVLDDTAHDYMARMRNAATRMQTLINDLLTLSRITTKGQPFKPIDLADVVQAVVSDLETVIEQSNGEVQLGPLPTLEADPLQMRQLFQNLISNALKFHDNHGFPCVKIYSEEPEKRADMVYHRILVEDNGIGFDEKYLDRIFQPFQRLHGRNSYTGTGMGLAICRKIVERHGGSITARSRPASGATFIVTLPTEQAKGMLI